MTFSCMTLALVSQFKVLVSEKDTSTLQLWWKMLITYSRSGSNLSSNENKRALVELSRTSANATKPLEKDKIMHKLPDTISYGP